MPDRLKILLIEDDPDDIQFLCEALDEHGPEYSVETLIRGDLVAEWMQTTTGSPDVIIMDLNLPKIHGREVLCQIKANKKFSSVPLVVLTTSSLPEDEEYCLTKGANTFLSKPSSPEGFKKVVESIVQHAGKQQMSGSSQSR